MAITQIALQGGGTTAQTPEMPVFPDGPHRDSIDLDREQVLMTNH